MTRMVKSRAFSEFMETTVEVMVTLAFSLILVGCLLLIFLMIGLHELTEAWLHKLAELIIHITGMLLGFLAITYTYQFNSLRESISNYVGILNDHDNESAVEKLLYKMDFTQKCFYTSIALLTASLLSALALLGSSSQNLKPLLNLWQQLLILTITLFVIGILIAIRGIIVRIPLTPSYKDRVSPNKR